MPVCSGSRHMDRAALSPLMLALAMAGFSHGATAQQVGDPSESRGPRFLLATAERSRPVPVDLTRSAVLRRPLSLAFDSTPLKQAPAEISRPAGPSLGYAAGVLPAATLADLRADPITGGPALMGVLLAPGGAGVFPREGRAPPV